MRKFFVSFLLLGSFFILTKSFAANSDIIINEIGAYEAGGHEWIEIWNKGSEPVDLTGWKFWENSTNHGLSVSTTDAVVAPGEYAVIVQDANQFILDYPSFSGSVFDSSWSSLNESGEEIGLKDAGGNFVEKFTYVAAPNFSLQRRDANLNDYTSVNWAEHASGNTVGAINNFETPAQTPTTTPPPTQTAQQTGSSAQASQIIIESPPQNLTPIKINEFVSDPESGNEWVELYNTGSANLDLAGAMICDSRNTTSTCKKVAGAIEANKWFVVDLNTRSFLNNGGDSVIFKDSQGATIDRIDYDDELVPDKGQSAARKKDGADTDSENDWIITDKVTMGQSNVVTKQNQSNIISTTTSNPAGLTASATTTTKKISPTSKTKSASVKTSGFVSSIESAKQAKKGARALVKGVVTVLPGIFGSQYFYLTDGTAGIQIYQSKKDFPPLAVGDLAQVYGKISEANGIKRINIKSKDDVDILSIGHAVTSTELNVDEIDESLAGGLAQIQGEITEIKSNLMYVDNGSGEMIVYFKQGAKIDKHKFLEGENARVTGVLEQTKSGWQIWPRSNADIESLGPSADLLKKQAANTGGDATEKYLTATAGGVTTLLLAFFARARGAFLKRVALVAVGFIRKNKA